MDILIKTIYIMPRSCNVVGCYSNLKSESEYVSIFNLPVDVKLKEAWLKKIPNDVCRLKRPQVCIKHFEEKDVIWYDKCTVKGELKEFKRIRPKLAPDAIPTIFQYVPKYLNRKPTVVRLADDEVENLEMESAIKANAYGISGRLSTTLEGIRVGQDLNVPLKVEKEERSENFCRTCLKKSSTLIPLDSDDVEDSVNIGDKLVSCIPDIVWSDNNHSKLICTNCLKSLRISYNFRKTCISTNETLAEKPDYQNHPEQKDFASEYLQSEIKIEPAEHPGECLDYIPVDEIKAEEYEITESGSTYVGDPQELSYPNDDKNLSNQSATTIDVLPEIFSDQERGKRKSTCKYCLKSVVPSYLKHHERLHTGYKPYACGKCHETFRMQTMLNKHILKHHTEENSVRYNDMSIMMSM